MRVTCASASCKYSLDTEDSSQVIFINFPNDESAKLWAQSCGRPDLLMKSNEELHLNYYICSHHIEDRYYVNKSDPIVIQHGAVPTLFNRQLNYQKDNSLNGFSRHNHMEITNNVTLTYCDINMELDQYHDISIRLSNLCRICGEPSSEGIEIYDEKGMKLRLKDKINLYMPVSNNVEHLMPQRICLDCYNKLEITHLLVLTCLRTDIRLRRYLNIEEAPSYDKRFDTLLQECSLEVSEEVAMDNGTEPGNQYFPSEKVGTNNELSVHIKECAAGTDVSEIHIVTETSDLQKSNINNIKFGNILKNDVHPDLNSFMESYKSTKTVPNDYNLQPTHAESNETSNEKQNNEILCIHCKDTFKTQEMFNNHKVLCVEEELVHLQAHKETSSDIEHKASNEIEAINMQFVVQTCNICEQIFETKQLFDKHRCSYCKPVHQIECQMCGQSFANNEEFIIHKHFHDKQTASTISSPTKKCGHCQDVFNTKKELLNHIMELHKGQLLFRCFACEKTYEKWASLDVHEATHRVDKPYLCDLCGKSFKHSNNLRGHKRIHLDDSKKKRHVCDVCGNAFRSRFHLREHMNQHNGNKPYSCEECGKAFYKRIQLRQHKLSHGSHKHTCPVCGMSFNRRGNMNTHLKRHNSDGLYSCSVCSHRCKSMSELKMHRKKHSEEDIIESIKKKSSDKQIWQCHACHKVFAKRSILICHERKHDGEKTKVECDICGKKLACKNSLLYHKKSTHSTERPHMCQYCGESFVSREARLIHERIHTGERPYVCKICDMQYRCSSNLSQHIKIHSNVRPHKCQFCGKAFTRKGALNVHERIHTGIKPYACETCGRKFSQKNDMLKHTKTHDLKPAECEHCNEIFPTRKDVLKHNAAHELNTTPPEEYSQVPQQVPPFMENVSYSDII